MQIIKNTTDFFLDGSYCVAIGKFDGIHIGHQYLLKCIEEYRKDGYKIAVFTFDPSPSAFFSNDEYKGLTTLDEKRRIFEKLGVDVLVEYPLNKNTARVSPEDFIEDILINKMNVRCVVCGRDFSFGDKGRGNVELLKAYGNTKGFEVRVCEKVKCDGIEISSSLIRKEVESGEMELVTKHIGAYYSFTGIVVTGRQLGRRLGMPTVNIIPSEDKLLPPFGVYEAVVSYAGSHFKGITNVGVKPTVTDERRPVVETYIFDFDEDIYGKEIIVNLVRMVRPEKKFGSVDELKAQIKSDIDFVRNHAKSADK